MDFLNNAYAQLLGVLKPMSASAKITTGLLLVVVVIGVTFLFQFDQLSGDEYLLGAHVFTQEELATAIAAFADAQLNDYTVENYRIRVPKSKRYQYVAAMSQAKAMPQTASDLWGQMFSGSLLESSEVKRWRNQYRKKRELERTLAEMTGVKSATVQFDVEPSNSLIGTPKKSCLVAVTPTFARPIDNTMIQSVRETAAFWLNMHSNEVGVLDMFANRTYRGDSMGSFSAGEDDYSAYKSIRENELSKKLYDQLSFIPGAKINVQIELEPEVRREITSIKYDEKPTTLHSSASTEDETINSGSGGGRPGVAANNDPNAFANSAASVAQNTNETTRNSSKEEQRSVVGQERTTREVLPFSPKHVTVSIGVPKSHITNIYQQENAPADGSETPPPDPSQLAAIEDEVKSNVENLVNNLLPPVNAGLDPYPRVAFRVFNDLKATPVEGPTQGAIVMEWLQENWTSLGMGLLGLMGIVFLRGMLKAGQKSEEAAGGSEGLAGFGINAEGGAGGIPGSPGAPGSPGVLGDNLSEEDSELAESLKDRYSHAGAPNLREELADMVRDDPDAAATVLGMWIGDG